MPHFPDYWRRCAWLAVTAAIAGLSYWMFFTGAGAGRADRTARPANHHDIHSPASPAAANRPLTDAGRHK